jgi:hypothetical protein
VYLLSIKEFLIKENIKQAKKFLQSIGEEEPNENPVFKHIVDKLSKRPNYVDTFTRMIFSEKDASDENLLNEFDKIVDWILKNKDLVKRLPKNILQYEKIEELSDDISELERQNIIKKFTNSLYSSMRRNVQYLSNEQLDKYEDLAYRFMTLPEHTRNDFTELKYFKMNNISFDEFLDAIESFLDNNSVNKDMPAVLDYIKNNNIEVVYNKNKVLGIKTKDRQHIKYLTPEKWCINYSDYHYNMYLANDNYSTNFIIFNFNVPASSKYSLFGLTMRPNGTFREGAHQNRKNEEVTKKDIIYYTGAKDIYDYIKSDYWDEYVKYNKELFNLLNSIDEKGFEIDIKQISKAENFKHSEDTPNMFRSKINKHEIFKKMMDYYDNIYDSVKGFINSDFHMNENAVKNLYDTFNDNSYSYPNKVSADKILEIEDSFKYLPYFMLKIIIANTENNIELLTKSKKFEVFLDINYTNFNLIEEIKKNGFKFFNQLIDNEKLHIIQYLNKKDKHTRYDTFPNADDLKDIKHQTDFDEFKKIYKYFKNNSIVATYLMINLNQEKFDYLFENGNYNIFYHPNFKQFSKNINIQKFIEYLPKVLEDKYYHSMYSNLYKDINYDFFIDNSIVEYLYYGKLLEGTRPDTVCAKNAFVAWQKKTTNIYKNLENENMKVAFEIFYHYILKYNPNNYSYISMRDSDLNKIDVGQILNYVQNYFNELEENINVYINVKESSDEILNFLRKVINRIENKDEIIKSIENKLYTDIEETIDDEMNDGMKNVNLGISDIDKIVKKKKRYSEKFKGKVNIDLSDYVYDMIANVPDETKNLPIAYLDNLFEPNEESVSWYVDNLSEEFQSYAGEINYTAKKYFCHLIEKFNLKKDFEYYYHRYKTLPTEKKLDYNIEKKLYDNVIEKGFKYNGIYYLETDLKELSSMIEGDVDLNKLYEDPYEYYADFYNDGKDIDIDDIDIGNLAQILEIIKYYLDDLKESDVLIDEGIVDLDVNILDNITDEMKRYSTEETMEYLKNNPGVKDNIKIIEDLINSKEDIFNEIYDAIKFSIHNAEQTKFINDKIKEAIDNIPILKVINHKNSFYGNKIIFKSSFVDKYDKEKHGEDTMLVKLDLETIIDDVDEGNIYDYGIGYADIQDYFGVATSDDDLKANNPFSDYDYPDGFDQDYMNEDLYNGLSFLIPTKNENIVIKFSDFKL